MKKQYETLELDFIWYDEDMVRTSSIFGTGEEIEVNGAIYGDGWSEA